MLRQSLRLLDKTFLRYSRLGPLTTYSFRQRYPSQLYTRTDNVIADFLFAKSLKHVWADAPCYNYMWAAYGAAVMSFLYVMRCMMFDPDVQFRKFDLRLPQPDKTHLHSYCLPYFNSTIRNVATKHLWNIGQNEVDWIERSYSGLRPTRQQCHRRIHYWSCMSWTTYRYRIQDPLYTTNSHYNMEKVYHDMGYRKLPWLAHDDE